MHVWAWYLGLKRIQVNGKWSVGLDDDRLEDSRQIPNKTPYFRGFPGEITNQTQGHKDPIFLGSVLVVFFVFFGIPTWSNLSAIQEKLRLSPCDESNHRFFWHLGNRNRYLGSTHFFHLSDQQLGGPTAWVMGGFSAAKEIQVRSLGGFFHLVEFVKKFMKPVS